MSCCHIDHIDIHIHRLDGRPALDAATVPLTNAVETLPADEQYSFIFGGGAQVLDHALLNDAALNVFSYMRYARGNVDAPELLEDDVKSELRISDHDGFVLYLSNDPDLLFRDGVESP